MDYDAAIQKIKKLQNFGSKPGLERITKLLNLVDNPQNKLNCIHVAGTNGKGSVCFILEAILREAGYKTGRYISPEICDFCERIAVNGENISRRSVANLVGFFEHFVSNVEFQADPITEFELTTAMAFKFFADEKCDIAIIETGMGGKLDATNVIKNPVCSVITSIDFDHTKILGNTIKKIASEKCGIIKPLCPIVISEQQYQETTEIISAKAENCRSTLKRASAQDLTGRGSLGLQGIKFCYKNTEFFSPILGSHQFTNLACALKVLETVENKFHVNNQSIKKALKTLKIPCRLECVCENPTIILDAAHNPHGTLALANFLKSNVKNHELYGIVGMFKDKDYDKALKNVLGFFKNVYTISPNSKRAESLDKITICAKKYCENVVPCENIDFAVHEAIKSAKKDGIIVVFGSFSVMKDFKNLNLGVDFASK